MRALARLTQPARWLLMCLLGFGLAGVGSTVAARSVDSVDGLAPQKTSSSQRPARTTARPAPEARLSHLTVGPPIVADSWIAFSDMSEAGVPGLYLMAPDGSGVHRIGEGEAAELDRAWSRDGTAIVFCGSAGGSSTAPASGCAEDVNGPSNGLPPARGATYFDTRPVPAPDGRTLALVRVHQVAPASASLVLYDLATATSSTIVAPRANVGRQFDWAPDGSVIAYSAAPFGVEDLWISSVDGRTRRQLTDLPGGQSASSPTFSPDGQWIMFRLLGNGEPRLLRIRPNGTGLSLVAQLTDMAPDRLDWSPAFLPKPAPWLGMRPPGTGHSR